jgi:hypothetical protein
VELFIEATNIERIASNSPVSAAQIDQAGNNEFQHFWAQRRGDEWKARSEIVNALAPWLSGVPVPKLALLLTLIGGVPVDNSVAEGDRDAKWLKYLVDDKFSRSRLIAKYPQARSYLPRAVCHQVEQMPTLKRCTRVPRHTCCCSGIQVRASHSCCRPRTSLLAAACALVDLDAVAQG